MSSSGRDRLAWLAQRDGALVQIIRVFFYCWCYMYWMLWIFFACVCANGSKCRHKYIRDVWAESSAEACLIEYVSLRRYVTPIARHQHQRHIISVKSINVSFPLLTKPQTQTIMRPTHPSVLTTLTCILPTLDGTFFSDFALYVHMVVG